MDDQKVFFFALITFLAVCLTLNYNLLVLGGALCFFGFILKKFSSIFLICCCLFLVVSFISLLNKNKNYTNFSEKKINFAIYFTEQPTISGNQLTGYVRDEKSDELLFLRYTIPSEKEFKRLQKLVFDGKSYQVTGKLEKPPAKTIENGFDYRKFLYYKKCHWLLISSSLKTKSDSFHPLAYVSKVRTVGTQFIQNNFPEPLQRYLLALIFGSKKQLSDNEYESYQKLGVIHLLVISGAHVGLLFMGMYYICLRLGLISRTAQIIILFCLPIYACLTGFAPAVNRAVLMMMIFFSGKIFNYKISSLKTVCLCLILTLLFSPYMIFSVGWQLSFAICISLTLSTNLLENIKNVPLKRWVLTVICQLSTVPILLYHFHEISIISFFINIVYIPIFTLIYFPVALIVFLAKLLIPFVGNLFIPIGNMLFKGFIFISESISNAPYVSIIMGKPSLLILSVLSILILCLFIAMDIKNAWLTTLFSFLIILSLTYQANFNKLSSSSEITFLDIGQGDSIFIKLPYNQGNYLIDTGGILSFSQATWKRKTNVFDTGKDIIAPFLKSKGISRIDYLILSHADQDHIGGSEFLLKKFQVKTILAPLGQKNEFNKRPWFKKASKNINIKYVRAGYNWKIGSNSFEVLHPKEKLNTSDTNHNCLVLLANINGVKWLFTGDLDTAGEEKILTLYKNLKADVIKIGHHGSKTSSSMSFIKEVKPKLAVISVGKNNHYRHPSQEVIALLKSEKIAIKRTDQDGTIQFLFTNKTVIIKNYPPFN